MVKHMVIVGSKFKITICWLQEFEILILPATTSQNFGRNYGIDDYLGSHNLAWFMICIIYLVLV